MSTLEFKKESLEKGLTHHHRPCRTIKMCKADGAQAKNDEENVQVFTEHFSKLLNNQSPLPCDLAALDLIEQSHEFTHLENPITVKDVRAALTRMANAKAAGPSGIMPDALNAMVWREEGLEADADEPDNDNANHLAS
eukprot:15342456-Ditylum_brightwellii.AAC.1